MRREGAKTELAASQNDAFPYLESLVAGADYATLVPENDRVRIMRRASSPDTVPVPTLRWPCILLIGDLERSRVSRPPGASNSWTPAWPQKRPKLQHANLAGFPAALFPGKRSKTKSWILARENQSVTFCLKVQSIGLNLETKTSHHETTVHRSAMRILSWRPLSDSF